MRRTLALTALAGGLLTAVIGTATAEPLPDAPGTYPATNGAGGTPTAPSFITAVGADADAELFDNIAKSYNAQAAPADARILSFDAVNPLTGTVEASPIHIKPGCDITRPNGANAGLTAILKNQVSSAATSNPQAGDGTTNCIDVVRASRSKKTDGTEAGLTFYSLTRDAVTWATIGGSYAPDRALTTKEVRGIYECYITNWAEVGGQYGAIHVYAPPTSAATYTFFLSSIGSSVTNVTNGCGAGIRATQQNDGTQIGGDPQGITPYAVTKWAAQRNAPAGISDLRGGTVLGGVPLSDGSTVAPVITDPAGSANLVLNPAFASGTGGATSTQGRVLYNTVRNGSPLAAMFNSTGYVCTNQATLLPPFGAVPLGSDTSQTEYCGKPN